MAVALVALLLAAMSAFVRGDGSRCGDVDGCGGDGDADTDGGR